jgi:hypothetical protein
MGSQITAFLSIIGLACRIDWAMFVSLCRKSLILQPWKLEVISLISPEREIPSFVFVRDVYETDRFS